MLLAWLVFRTLLWTLLAWCQANPGLDTVEWLAWGHQWELGYHKHPPLAAWLAELAWLLAPGSFALLYLVSYLALAVALYAVWLVAKRFLPARLALAAVLALEGLCFLGSYGQEYNNQVLLIALWAAAIAAFVHADRSENPWHWALTGLLLGLAFLCKYTALTLLLPLVAWELWYQRLRRWRLLSLLLLLAFAVVLPHVYWLVTNGGTPLEYAARRMAGLGPREPAWLAVPLFLQGQLLRVCPAVLLVLWLVRIRSRTTTPDQHRGRSLLCWLVLGPLLLTVAPMLLGNVQRRDIWGAPLWTFAPLLVLLYLEARTGERGWNRFRVSWVAVVALTFSITLVHNLWGSALTPWPLRSHFPGKELARQVNAGFQQQFGELPAIIAGDWWLAGNVCCHSPHRPTLYGSREPSACRPVQQRALSHPEDYRSPVAGTCRWTDDDEFQEVGGVLLWSADWYGETLPAELQARFPTARTQPALQLNALGGSRFTFQIGWAFLPPRR